MSISPKVRIFLWGMFALLLDFVSKELTVAYLPMIGEESWHYPYGGIPVFENFLGIEFSLSFTTNTGAAWGVGGDHPELLNMFRISLIAVLSIVYWCFVQDKKYLWPLALVLSGATGNVFDFLRYGHVIDMINFKFWCYDYPVFNIADSLIFIGVFWLAYLSFTEKKVPHGSS